MAAEPEPVARRKQHYHDYAEMTALLRGWADTSPLATLSTIGTSEEGRELWLLALTDGATGPAESKPAFWVEANTHAGEITGTEAALHLIDTLLSSHAAELEEDEEGGGPMVALFRAATVYVLPRISVDGAELFLTTRAPPWPPPPQPCIAPPCPLPCPCPDPQPLTLAHVHPARPPG